MRKITRIVLAVLCSTLFGTVSGQPVRAGLYCDLGSRGACNVYWGRILAESPDVELTYLDGKDIRSGKLSGLDILVMPGGTGFGQYDSMQGAGADEIRRFIRDGGKYFGTCAGMALLLNETNRVGLLPYRRMKGHYLRGGGRLKVRFNTAGMELLALSRADWTISYHNGPIVVPADAVDGVRAETIGVCENGIDENPENGPDRRDAMVGSPAFVHATYGKGELFACNCHPEKERATRALVSAVFRRLTGRAIALPQFDAYPPGSSYKASGKEGLVRAVRAAAREKASVWVDARKGASTDLPNVSSTVTVWNGRTADWSRKGANDGSYPIREFVRYVELMSATGGSAERDLLKDPADRSVLDDYDFAPLVQVCREVLAMGAKPYLKLGNVPSKFSAAGEDGAFRVNVRPPADDRVHARYMRACAAALKAAFGVDELRTWRFAVLTEADNFAWFSTPGKDAVSTREAFFRLYDHTAKAFAEELGDGLCFGTHVLYPDDKTWLSNKPGVLDYERFFAHCEREKSMLGLFTISYYVIPGKRPPQGDLSRLPDVVASAAAHGFTNLVFGVDEGRVLFSTPGKDRKDLLTRAVGASYEAAFDVLVAKSVLDAGAHYFAAWGFFSGPNPLFEGVPSFAYFTGREIARFEGLRRVPTGIWGAMPAGETLEAFAARSANGHEVRVAACRFRDSLAVTNALATSMAVTLPKDFHGKTVRVETLTLDDRNNWFVDWSADRARHGIGNDDFSWSGDDLAPLSAKGLRTSEHRRLFAEELQRAYAAKAAQVKPVVTDALVSEKGNVNLPLFFVGNGAAFVVLRLK